MDYNSFVMSLFSMICLTEKSVGVRHERKAVAAFQGEFNDVPDWFIRIENAYKHLEGKGIDILVQTVDIRRPVYVQIKSCVEKAEKFKKDQLRGRYRKDIAVVVIREEYTPQQIRRIVIDAVSLERMRIFKGMSEKHGFTYIPDQGYS